MVFDLLPWDEELAKELPLLSISERVPTLLHSNGLLSGQDPALQIREGKL